MKENPEKYENPPSKNQANWLLCSMGDISTENLASKKSEALRYIIERHAKFDYEKQSEFNSKFKLEGKLAVGETLKSYIEKRLEDSKEEEVKKFLADSNDDLQFGNSRSHHGAYHSIITAAYAGMFADFYSKNFAGNFGISKDGLTEEQKNMAMILTSAHDIARQHGYLARDEHNNAFYLALILRDKFGLPQDTAIEWASHIEKKDEDINSDKTIFSRLTQCADCAAIARVHGSNGFKEEFLDAKKDIDVSIKDSGKSSEAKNNLKSILDFTKAFEDEMKKGNYDKKLTSFDGAIKHITEIANSLSRVNKDPFLKHLESFRAHEPNAAVIKDAGLTISNLTIFPQPNAAEEFNKLSDADRRKISERTRITVTQEEIDHAKRFIALVAITEGETGRTIDKNEISQKEVYEQQGILPHNCLKDCKEGSLEEKINFVAAKITPENIRAFYKRLIEKRPKVFYNPGDDIVQRADTPHKIQDDLNLLEYVGYSEIEFGAMLQVFGATQFINDGGRGNQGKKRVVGQAANAGDSGNSYKGYVSGAHEKLGYISAIVGMRLETENPAMERLHVIEGEREKAIQQYHSSKGDNEKGDFARMKNVKIDFVEGHKLIWDQFYKQNSQQKGGSSTAAGGAFNDEVAEQRLYISYKKFLAESIANAKQDGKKAHIRITGCGDGVWANGNSTKIKFTIGRAVRKAFDQLGKEQKSQISAIEFCQYGGEDYYNAFTQNDLNKEKLIDGVKIVSSGAKFSDKLKEDEKKSDEKDTVLCVNFAWDGGSYVGNEYWSNKLSASGDPAAACCSSIAISMNPEINPQFLDKLFVVSKNGVVSEVDGKSSTIEVTPKLTEQDRLKSSPQKLEIKYNDSEELKKISKQNQRPIEAKKKVIEEKKKVIEEKIFVDPDGGELLSAKDVAIRKIVGSKKEPANKVRSAWLQKELEEESKEEESVLDYGAYGVFKKALEAQRNLNNESRDTITVEEWGQKDSEEWKKKSQEFWYHRFVKTNFEGVNFEGIFRPVFVNCTFDENCVFPTEKNSIDPKYFLNCTFSEGLMDKEENRELKKALTDAGMIKESGVYKIKHKKQNQNPNPSFKPIESFQLIEGYAKEYDEKDR